MPSLAIPTPLVYWRRPWANAHIFTECPRFIKEWAGWNFQQYRTAKTLRQASRHTSGLCAMCWFVYQRQTLTGRPELAAGLRTSGYSQVGESD